MGNFKTFLHRIEDSNIGFCTVFITLFLSLLAIGIGLRINNLDNVSARSPDEKTYTYRAKIIAQQGIVATKLLVQEYNLDKKQWVYPPPTRIGYLWLLAGVMKIAKNIDEKVGAYISCTFSIISLLLLIVLGLRFFNPWITSCALLFMSVSPMDLAIARRTWQDAMLGCVGLLLIYFCCEIARNLRKIIWHILFIAVGSYSILIKETGTIIYGLCILWLLWILFFKKRAFLHGIILIIVSALGIGVSILVLAHAAGGITPLIEVLTHIKKAMSSNRYAIEYQSGPWHYLLQGFWIISPVNTFLCVFGIVGMFLQNQIPQKITSLPNDKNLSAIFGIIFFMIAFMAIAIATPYCQNLRYVSVLFVPFYLMAGLGLWYIILFIKTLLKNTSFYIVIFFLAGTLILTAVSDYQIFKKIFVRTGILDVSARMIREYSQ